MHNVEKYGIAQLAGQLCALSALAALLLCSAARESSAADVRVGVDGDYDSIIEALENIKDGDNILVTSGSYEGNLVIDKSVKIIGTDNPRIIGLYDADVVKITAENVEVTGFEISRSGLNMMYGFAGVKIEADSAVIKNNKLSDNLFGIYLKNCDYANVENNRIVGRKDRGQGERGSGISIYNSNYNRISGNEVSYVRDGIYFDHADFNAVEDNVFSDLRYGVHYMYCDDNSFVRNTFRDSAGGVAIMYTERVIFSDNLIINNRAGFNAFGLLYKDASECIAERNIIINSVSGVFLEGGKNNVFRSNLLAYNDVGVTLYASSLDNSFGGNDFIGNLSDLKTIGKAKADWNAGRSGNYYSSFSGFDVDGDGIGDVPHALQNAFEHLEGGNPVLRLYLSSGAADAMILAEKTFPIVSNARTEDAFPLMKPVSGLKLSDADGGKLPGNVFSAVLALLATGGVLMHGWRSSK